MTIHSRAVNRIENAEFAPGGTDAHRVRLVVVPGEWEEHDPFLMMAEDWFTPGTFDDHPHRGIETVTYILEGELTHRDNHGGAGKLRPGDAQWMTAGRGIIHNEDPVGHAHSLQLWVNLPRKDKLTATRYQDIRGESVPVREEQGAKMKVFSGRSGDVVSPTLNHVPVTMVELLLKPNARVVQQIPGADRAFIYILEGKGRFGSDSRPASEAQVVWFEPVSDSEMAGASEIVIESDGPLRAILWSGTPLREPVAAYGPFVMNTMEEIKQAFDDYRSGLF